MTVRIVEEPPNAYHATCSKCGCKFSYALSDLRKNYGLTASDGVNCPQCGRTHRHPDQRAGRWNDTFSWYGRRS